MSKTFNPPTAQVFLFWCPAAVLGSLRGIPALPHNVEICAQWAYYLVNKAQNIRHEALKKSVTAFRKSRQDKSLTYQQIYPVPVNWYVTDSPAPVPDSSH